MPADYIRQHCLLTDILGSANQGRIVCYFDFRATRCAELNEILGSSPQFSPPMSSDTVGFVATKHGRRHSSARVSISKIICRGA